MGEVIEATRKRNEKYTRFSKIQKKFYFNYYYPLQNMTVDY